MLKIAKTDIRITLNKELFYITKDRTKREDYCEINCYWVRKLYWFEYELELCQVEAIVDGFKSLFSKTPKFKSEEEICATYDMSRKTFVNNIVTLKYPKPEEYSKIIALKHEGFDIGYGKVEWGAKKKKPYFIIKHGEII